MGYKETWLLMPQADQAAVLARMQLRPARADDGPPVARALRLPPAADGIAWTLLCFDYRSDATEPFRQEAAQAAWSRGTELLGLEINESVNYSWTFGLRDGGARWTLQHVLDEGQEHLAVEGEPPAGWRAIHNAELAQLRAGEGGDRIFSVPIDALALRIGVTPYTVDLDDGENDADIVPLVLDLPPPDAATQQLLAQPGSDGKLPPERLQAASLGDAGAQLDVGLALVRCDPQTAAHGERAQFWLERAANQGLGAAQAVLGTCICQGRPGFERDMRVGQQWLELSAAQEHLEGLTRLADHLFDISVNRRGERVKAADDAASAARLTRMLALLERAVELGGKVALVDLANRVYDGIGAPHDDVAAKALVQIARAQAPDRLPQDNPDYDAIFVPTPEEAPEVAQLVRDWGASGKALVRGLRARRAAKLAHVEGLKAQAAAAREAARAAQTELDGVRAQQNEQRSQARREAFKTVARTRDGSPVGSLRWAPGCTALVLGIGFFLLALALAPRGMRGLAGGLLTMGGLCGAWGAWRLGAVREWNVATRGLVAALMLVPGVGLLLSLRLILKQVRQD